MGTSPSAIMTATSCTVNINPPSPITRTVLPRPCGLSLRATSAPRAAGQA